MIDFTIIIDGAKIQGPMTSSCDTLSTSNITGSAGYPKCQGKVPSVLFSPYMIALTNVLFNTS